MIVHGVFAGLGEGLKDARLESVKGWRLREVQKRTRDQFRVQGVMPGAPTGIRTPVLALKGLRPGPLDDGGIEPHCTIHER